MAQRTHLGPEVPRGSPDNIGNTLATSASCCGYWRLRKLWSGTSGREICLRHMLGVTLVSVLVDLVTGTSPRSRALPHLTAVTLSSGHGWPPRSPDPAELKAGDGDCIWTAGTNAGSLPWEDRRSQGRLAVKPRLMGILSTLPHSRAPVGSAPRVSGRDIAARDSGCAGYLLPCDKAPQPLRLKTTVNSGELRGFQEVADA